MKKGFQVVLFILAAISPCAAESTDKIEAFLGTWQIDFKINSINYTRYYQFHELDTLTTENPLQRGPEQTEFAVALGTELQTNNEVMILQLRKNRFSLYDESIVPDTIANYYLRFLLGFTQKVVGLVMLEDSNDLEKKIRFSKVRVEKVAEEGESYIVPD